MGTFFYCIKEGFKNIKRNLLFSLASAAIISACIFLFCLFFALISNVQYMVRSAETTVGVTVFFDENLTEPDILAIGEQIKARPEVSEADYVSADAAWETFQKEYFKDVEELADGFADDNPLADSASYEIYLYNIEDQKPLVNWLNSIEGIRKVNYSSDTASGLSTLNRVISLVSVVIIGVLLAVAVFLISNTISTAAHMRKDENRIMRLIGATNFMIRAPFVVEGVVIGLFGAAVPLVIVSILYKKIVAYILENFGILNNIIEFVPLEQLLPQMVSVAMILGVGIGFVGSFFTIRKTLRV